MFQTILNPYRKKAYKKAKCLKQIHTSLKMSYDSKKAHISPALSVRLETQTGAGWTKDPPGRAKRLSPPVRSRRKFAVTRRTVCEHVEVHYMLRYVEMRMSLV